MRRRKGSNSKLGMMARLYFFSLIRQKATAMTSSERTAIVTPEKVEGKFRSLPGKKDNERERERAVNPSFVTVSAAPWPPPPPLCA